MNGKHWNDTLTLSFIHGYTALHIPALIIIILSYFFSCPFTKDCGRTFFSCKQVHQLLEHFAREESLISFKGSHILQNFFYHILSFLIIICVSRVPIGGREMINVYPWLLLLAAFFRRWDVKKGSALWQQPSQVFAPSSETHLLLSPSKQVEGTTENQFQ